MDARCRLVGIVTPRLLRLENLGTWRGVALFLQRIEILNYKRLVSASAYVGRKTMAFVGPNEAGKSSVLSALRLFDNDEPVDTRTVSRTSRGSSAPTGASDVVKLSFSLDDDQLANLSK